MDCLFCRIASGEISAKIVYQDEQILCFEDINPAAPVHLLVIPRTHIPNAFAVKAEDSALIGHIFAKIPQISAAKGLEQFRVVTNAGEDAGQTVFHLHFHLLGGKPLQTALG